MSAPSDGRAARRRAVITGASSGIGRELALLVAADGLDVVLVARRAERLEALAKECVLLGVDATSVPVDLADPGGAEAVVAALGGAAVDVLINDAGVGGHGRFVVGRALAADLAMIQLNIASLVHLTGLLLPGMLDRGHGAILNVASIAGYIPGPGQAVYNASKAFVRSFSQALTVETQGTGVQVTTLCPGPVDTEFAAVAGYAPIRRRSNPLMPVLSAAEVATAGWEGLKRGRSVVVPGSALRIGIQAVRFLPWRLVARSAERK
ncbi:SDR family oxidoreductase [Microlunatus panaciterrae]|uniref:Short-subunit dehydrogenase n=1 Tax=Microlunatus panaciterrae TaxID=400768 RepID=A0ABS2RHY6_9ACTN|nr:SDR family oxidoreductase [Microlunatus panaciterrae]MBM7798600.1 short-subunit dehydrogenase [Microlunatus panaciterrae]